MRLQRKLFAIFTAAVILCAVDISVMAREAPDTSRRGSIQITMRFGGNAVSGGSLTLYQAGDITETDGGYGFTLTGNFTGSGAGLEDIQSVGLAEKLAQYARDNNLTGITKAVDGEGKVLFDDLEPGLYLLVQEVAADGYHAADPFLVSVPMLEEDQYQYDVDASPKVELEKKTEPEAPDNPEEPSTSTSASPPPETPDVPRLPQTGQLAWPVPVLVVLGLGLLAVGWILRFGKRKEEYEE